MSELEKINIYVPSSIGTILESDARLFEIYKKDGHIVNRNRFLSMLIQGYYDSYTEERQSLYNSIIEELVSYGIKYDKSNLMAKQLIDKVIFPHTQNRGERNSCRLSLKPTKDNEALIMSIISNLQMDDTIAQYFRRMIISYSEKPITEREQIIFHDNYELIKKACREKRPIVFSNIRNLGNIHKVIPYDVAIGKEEMFNYLLCAEYNDYKGRQEAHTYRINRIATVRFFKMPNVIEDNVIKYLDFMKKLGPQYPINDEDETCVRLTIEGEKKFNNLIYYGRPELYWKEEKEDGVYCYFKGSKEQLLFYFSRFGEDAEIIYPDYLRKKMADYYYNANKLYY